MIMQTLVNILTVMWLGGWALFAIKRIGTGKRESVNFVIMAHSWFSGMPLVLTLLMGSPQFDIYPGFRIASHDATTALIYDLYVCLVPLILWRFGRHRHQESFPSFALPEKLLRYAGGSWPVFLFPLAAPLIVALTSPTPSAYLGYAVSLSKGLTPAAAAHHEWMSIASLLSVGTAALLLLAMNPLKTLHIFAVAPWLVLSCWLNGKRFIVLLSIAMLGYVLWQKGTVRGVRLFALSTVALAAFVLFSVAYQADVRDFGATRTVTEQRESIRIDYGREAQIKMTIFAELHPEQMRILEFRGQSLLFSLTAYIPRSWWVGKPLPYAQYFTSALFLSPPQFWGWGMTTSWLEEAIANFGWFGIVIGPLLPALICRISDSGRSVFMQILGTLNATLLLAVELVAFMPLFLIWLVLVFVFVVRTKRGRNTLGRQRNPRFNVDPTAGT